MRSSQSWGDHGGADLKIQDITVRLLRGLMRTAVEISKAPGKCADGAVGEASGGSYLFAMTSVNQNR